MATHSLILGVLGLSAALVLLKKGIIKPSYPDQDPLWTEGQGATPNPEAPDDDTIPHRREILKEIVFLSPIILGAILSLSVFLPYGILLKAALSKAWAMPRLGTSSCCP